MEKSPFKLRRRKLADGRMSLFLDRSVDGGHEYEFLQLYLLPETSSTAKRQNARTLREAYNAGQEAHEKKDCHSISSLVPHLDIGTVQRV